MFYGPAAAKVFNVAGATEIRGSNGAFSTRGRGWVADGNVSSRRNGRVPSHGMLDESEHTGQSLFGRCLGGRSGRRRAIVTIHLHSKARPSEQLPRELTSTNFDEDYDSRDVSAFDSYASAGHL
jgi:hypothetical protein